MDILKVLQWIILIFAFYVFIFYAFFRIIYRKLKESDIKSRVKAHNPTEPQVNVQKSEKIIPKSKVMF